MTTPEPPEPLEPLEPEVLEGEIVDEVAPAGPPPVVPEGDYTQAGVPTFDYVRDRIEGRAATSAGATELPEEAARTGSLDEQMAKREQAGRDKLEEIRRAMRER